MENQEAYEQEVAKWTAYYGNHNPSGLATMLDILKEVYGQGEAKETSTGNETLDNLIASKKQLEEEIMCQEIGNDFYCTSPLYTKHQHKLYQLNQEIDKLIGKSAIAI